MKCDVVVVGGVFREYQRTGANKWTPQLGGSGLTAALCSAAMGAAVSLMGHVGAEDRAALDSIAKWAGVESEHVVTLPGASGAFLLGTEDIPSVYKPGDQRPGTLPTGPRARVYLIFGHPEFDPALDATIREITAGGIVLWDRQGWLSKTRDSTAIASLPARRRIYLANVDEALEEAVLEPVTGRVVLPTGFDAGVLKDGLNGALVVQRTRDGLNFAPVTAFPVRAASAIGTGDIFAGALAAGLARNQALEPSAEAAALATSVMLESEARLPPRDLASLVVSKRWRTGSFTWRWPIAN